MSVDRARFQRLEQLLHSALGLPPAARDAFLTEACGGDESLFAELAGLLRASRDTGSLRQGIVAAAASLGSGSGPPSIPGHEVVRRVGGGGMGIVFEAFDHELHRSLAVKVLPAAAVGAVDPQAHARFLAEARITGQLDHPGVVPVHGLGRDPTGQPYFTMRLVAGQTAHEVFALARAGHDGWSLARALDVVLKVCDAVAFAHDKGIVHRDLKPDNVMVGRFGEVYVLDWGVAKVLGHDTVAPLPTEPRSASGPLTTAGVVVGTPGYMAPEQALGQPVDTRSDVYAIGACLYYLLTGRVPYAATIAPPSSEALLAALRAGPPLPVTSLDPRQPPELVAICDRAMARQPEARYQTVQALAEDLRAWRDHRVVKAYGTGAWLELSKWVRRNRGLAAGLLVAFLTAVVGATATVIYAVRADANAEVADRKSQEATQHLDRFLKLVDVVTLRELQAEADGLWPEVPVHVAAMDDWLRRARELVSRRPILAAALAAIDAPGGAGKPRDNGSRPASRVYPRATELGIERRRLRDTERELARVRRQEVTDGTPDLAGLRRGLEQQKATLERTIAVLERDALAVAPATVPPTGDRFLHETLARLVEDLRAFEGPDGALTSVAQRRTEATTVREHTLLQHMAEWSQCIASIADPAQCERYQGLSIQPQLGLVPLGRNRAGLWEFWHPRSGARPHRNGAGDFVVGDDTGIVFVLIPGATFWMGAQDHDPKARNYDRDSTRGVAEPVHQVRLAPFFLAKHETSQGQWLRMAGNNPSRYGPEAREQSRRMRLSHPVEQVTFYACSELCQRMGLRLPTEAQWEYGCRAGTGSVFHTGDSVASLRGFANIADAGSGRFGEPGDTPEPEFSDGHGVHAPVGSYQPNGFGLHDMHGNVTEWCADGHTSYTIPAQPGDGARGWEDGIGRVIRGGSFSATGVRARSAARHRVSPLSAFNSLGCRLARPVVEGG